MAKTPNFKVGDLVMWKPDHHTYRDRHKAPHTFTVSDVYCNECSEWVSWDLRGCCFEYRLELANGPW